jgi:hypothetical protein
MISAYGRRSNPDVGVSITRISAETAGATAGRGSDISWFCTDSRA